MIIQKILFTLMIFFPAVVVAFTIPGHNKATTGTLFANNDDEGASKQSGGGLFSGVSNFFAELDAFVDDASARRLGAGAKFYGKRKSSFYGKDDKMKKQVQGYDPEGMYSSVPYVNIV